VTTVVFGSGLGSGFGCGSSSLGDRQGLKVLEVSRVSLMSEGDTVEVSRDFGRLESPARKVRASESSVSSVFTCVFSLSMFLKYNG